MSNSSGSSSGFGTHPRANQALVQRQPINLITNNFKIRSNNKGLIHTYSIDYIEVEAIHAQA